MAQLSGNVFEDKVFRFAWEFSQIYCFPGRFIVLEGVSAITLMLLEFIFIISPLRFLELWPLIKVSLSYFQQRSFSSKIDPNHSTINIVYFGVILGFI